MLLVIASSNYGLRSLGRASSPDYGFRFRIVASIPISSPRGVKMAGERAGRLEGFWGATRGLIRELMWSC